MGYVLARGHHVGSVVAGRYSVALALNDEPVNEAWSQNVLPKALLLQQLERTERGARVTLGGSESVSSWRVVVADGGGGGGAGGAGGPTAGIWRTLDP